MAESGQEPQESSSTLAIVEAAAEWAVDQTGLHQKIKPLAEHFMEVSEVCVVEVLLAVAKALECGIYLGKFGFPDERVDIPDYVKDMFKEGKGGAKKA